jgi:Ca-activated chloride channel family protein
MRTGNAGTGTGEARADGANRNRRLSLLSLLSLLGAAPLAAQTQEVSLRFLRPMAGQPAYGQVVVEVELVPPTTGVDQVELYLDGKRVATARRPPWRFSVDAGQGNEEHRFEAVASRGGAPVASASLRTASIRVDEEIVVDLRQLYVSVSRDEGLVGDLGQGDFVIEENGTERELVTFARGDVPFTAALLLDTSVSMEGDRLRSALEAARAFLAAVDPLDEVKLMLFGDLVRGETPFTNIPAVLSVGLGDPEAGGGTALNDAVYLAAKRLEARSGRKVILLVSDGVDVESVLDFRWIRPVLQRNQILLYWLRLPPPTGAAPVRYYTVWRDGEGHEREIQALTDAANASGGGVRTLADAGAVGAALAGLVRELRLQYVLGYYPVSGADDPSARRIAVRVKGPRGQGTRVRTQRGGPEALRLDTGN